METETRQSLRFFFTAAMLVVLTFLIPASIGLGAEGFDTDFVLQQFTFYIAGGIYLMGLFFIFMYELVMKKGDNRYGNAIAFSSPGETPSMSYFKRFGQFQLTLLSIIFFGIFGFFSFFIYKQNTFAGIGTLGQQFTPTAQLLYSIFLIPGAENLGLALVIGITIFAIRQIARKTNMDKVAFRIYSIFGAILMGTFYWYVNHLLRYPDQDVAIIKVLFFGLLQSLLVVITGSFVVGWMLHVMNNLFVDLQRLFSSDTVLAYMIGLLLIIVILYIIFFRKRLLGRKKQE